MSIEVMTKVWKCDLPRDLKIVALALADHADDYGRKIFPSIERVRLKCGYSRRSIDRKFAELRDRGILIEVARPKGKPVEYRMDLSSCAMLALPDEEGNDKMAYPPRQDGAGGTPPVAQGGTPPVAYKPSVEPSDKQIQVVFDRWSKLKRNGSGTTPRFTRRRQAAIRAMLDEGFSVQDLIAAVEGCFRSEFHTKGGHTDITLICSSVERVERFHEMGETDPEPGSRAWQRAEAARLEGL